jgi:hypothetical protein
MAGNLSRDAQTRLAATKLFLEERRRRGRGNKHKKSLQCTII